jgi:hypothetical protein
MTANFSCSEKVKEHQNTENKMSLLQTQSKLSKLQLGERERAGGNEGKLDYDELRRDTSTRKNSDGARAAF